MFTDHNWLKLLLLWAGLAVLSALTYGLALLIGIYPAIAIVWIGALVIGTAVERRLRY